MRKKYVKDKFDRHVEDACDGLIYVSEIDAEVLPVSQKEIRKGSIEGYSEVLGIAADEIVQTIPFDQFFVRLTEKKDWHGKREQDNAERWSRLRDFLESNLSRLKVLRVGEIRIDIYIVGINKDEAISGRKNESGGNLDFILP